MRRLINDLQLFRLSLVQLLMLLLECCYCGYCYLCRFLTESISQFHMYITYLARFMIFWKSLFLNEFVVQFEFEPFIFNYASRQSHEIWALQFPFLHFIKSTVPPNDACLYQWECGTRSAKTFLACLSFQCL